MSPLIKQVVPTRIIKPVISSDLNSLKANYQIETWCNAISVKINLICMYVHVAGQA